MRPRGVAGLAVATLLLIIGLVVFTAQHAHEDHTVASVTVDGSALGVPCPEEAELRAAVDESGHYATTPYRLETARCVDAYATATIVLTSVEADDDTALFRRQGAGWVLVDAGTDLGSADDHGVPTTTWDELFG